MLVSDCYWAGFRRVITAPDAPRSSGFYTFPPIVLKFCRPHHRLNLLTPSTNWSVHVDVFGSGCETRTGMRRAAPIAWVQLASAPHSPSGCWFWVLYISKPTPRSLSSTPNPLYYCFHSLTRSLAPEFTLIILPNTFNHSTGQTGEVCQRAKIPAKNRGFFGGVCPPPPPPRARLSFRLLL